MDRIDAASSLRLDLAAAYRLFAHYGMSDLIYTHLSARVPGTDNFLINPYGLMFDEITASSLVEVDPDGKPVGAGRANPAGFTIHSAIYAARPDVGAACHLHTREGMAVAALDCGLLPISQFAMQFHDRVAYHAYEGIALDLGERERLARDLGNLNAMILRNHGLLTVGRTIREAFIYMFYLQRSCEVQVDAMASGRPLVTPDAGICEHTARQFEDDGALQGELEWPAFLRLLDRLDPRWRS